MEQVVLPPSGAVIGYKAATLLQTAQAFSEGHKTVGGVLRDALLAAPSFEEALPLLSDTPLASPLYLIVGGLDTSAIITRDRGGPGLSGLANTSQDTSILGRQPVPPGAALMNMTDRMGEWYQVQTNWDPWIHESHWGCADAMANYTALEEQFCEEYIRLQYADLGKWCARTSLWQ